MQSQADHHPNIQYSVDWLVKSSTNVHWAWRAEQEEGRTERAWGVQSNMEGPGYNIERGNSE
jgi:hypothetical protein